jgi:hypothetical protein
MASRRDLKKDISYLYADLLTECFTISCLSPTCDIEKADALIDKIATNCIQFIKRAGRYDAKNNPALVKAYYKKLGADLLQDVLNIGKELEELSK